MVKEKKEIRRYRRFYGYDYSRGAALFITIVTNPRRRLFGAIINAKLQNLKCEIDNKLLAYEGEMNLTVLNFILNGGDPVNEGVCRTLPRRRSSPRKPIS